MEKKIYIYLQQTKNDEIYDQKHFQLLWHLYGSVLASIDMANSIYSKLKQAGSPAPIFWIEEGPGRGNLAGFVGEKEEKVLVLAFKLPYF